MGGTPSVNVKRIEYYIVGEGSTTIPLSTNVTSEFHISFYSKRVDAAKAFAARINGKTKFRNLNYYKVQYTISKNPGEVQGQTEYRVHCQYGNGLKVDMKLTAETYTGFITFVPDAQSGDSLLLGADHFEATYNKVQIGMVAEIGPRGESLQWYVQHELEVYKFWIYGKASNPTILFQIFQIQEVREVSGVSSLLSLETKTSDSLLIKYNSSSCGIVNIIADFDVQDTNVSQVIFTYTNGMNRRQYSNYPINLYKYLITEGCNIVIKAINIQELYFKDDTINDVVNKLVIYGLLRYFLWKLITGKFCLEILRNRYTESFFKILRQSEYACLEILFVENNIVDMNKYFIC